MFKLRHFCILSILVLFITGCSSNEDSDVVKKDDPIIFTSLTASKKSSFIDEVITISIDATAYKDIVVTTNKFSVKATKISANSYEIESTEAIGVRVKVVLENNNSSETKSIDLDFYEHGVKDNVIVEGIEIDVDRSDKLLELFGEPDGKLDSTNGEDEFWYYFLRGLYFSLDKVTKRVGSAYLYSYDGWTRTINDVTFTGELYPYEIGNSKKIAGGQTKMDEIVDIFGEPDEKHKSSNTSSNLKWYVYYGGVVFYFNSDSLDNYQGKPVNSMWVY